MWAIDERGQEIAQFSQNILMTFPYPDDATLESIGVSESRLIPVYYSTLVGHWILADSYVVDTTNNEITLNLNHFSKFSFVSVGQANEIYLPVVLRSTSLP